MKTTTTILDGTIDTADLHGEYLGSYGRRGGMGPTAEVYAVPLYAAEIRRLWTRLDSVECVTEEDRIFDRLKQLGALVSE